MHRDTVLIPEVACFVRIQVHVIITEDKFIYTHLKPLKSIKLHEFVKISNAYPHPNHHHD